MMQPSSVQPSQTAAGGTATSARRHPLIELPVQGEPSQASSASAPFNFVPLPEVVATVDVGQFPGHDAYANPADRHTGYLDVTLTTRSPVYVRCPLPLPAFQRADRGEESRPPYTGNFRLRAKNTPEFFHTLGEDTPVIPGSTLRGMLRELLEIVSYSKVDRVTAKRLFFRTFGNNSVGDAYGRRMVKGAGTRGDGWAVQVEAGFWRNRTDGTHAIEICDVARVEMDKVAAAFGLTLAAHPGKKGLRAGDLLYGPPMYYPNQDRWGPGQNATPLWAYQQKTVYVQADPVAQDYSHSGGKYLRYRRVNAITTTATPGYTEGTLVLTGPMRRKHMAFVFLARSSPTSLPVPNDSDNEDKRLVDRFHDRDQLSQWQERAFPVGTPSTPPRPRPGHLRDGEPVFFLRENGELTFFGRAQMFRLPYRDRPFDLVPEPLRQPTAFDLADAIFGYTRGNQSTARQGHVERAYASRVAVTEAALVPGQTAIWLEDTVNSPLVPHILATPKPTAFQQYLVQPEAVVNVADHLRHYDSRSDPALSDRPEEQRAVPRGHKLYWHQGERTATDLRALGHVGHDSTQHTQMRPLRGGVQFTFRVHFENLDDVELGALCWALQPLTPVNRQEYCHSLGMGKPLGMGAVALDATLYLSDRGQRYRALFAAAEDGTTRWATALPDRGEQLSDRAVCEKRVERFENWILTALGLDTSARHLYELERIGVLLKLMEWPGFPSVPAGQNGVGRRYLIAQRRPNTRYQTLGEFRDRPVLPPPAAFGPLTGTLRPTIEVALPPPPPPPPPPPQPPAEETTREIVVVELRTNRGVIKVRATTGEVITCENTPAYTPIGEAVDADVTRRDGVAIRARKR